MLMEPLQGPLKERLTEPSKEPLLNRALPKAETLVNPKLQAHSSQTRLDNCCTIPGGSRGLEVPIRVPNTAPSRGYSTYNGCDMG